MSSALRARASKLGDFFAQSKRKGRSGLPVLSVTIHDGIVRRDSLERKFESELEPEDHLLVQPGDLVYNMMRMWQGAMGIAKEEGVVSPAYVVCRSRQGVDSKYVYYYLKSPRMLKRLHDYSCGLTGDRLRLYFHDFAAVPATLPKPAVQSKIAALLGAWDLSLQNVGCLLRTKRRLYLGLVARLLDGVVGSTSCRDHKGGEGRGKGKTEYRLSDLFTERRESNRADLPLLSITSDRGVIRQSESDCKDNSADDKTRYKRIVAGDIGYNTMRMWQGVSALSQREGIVSPAYTICFPGSKIDGRFAKHLFKYQPMVHTFWRYSQGLVDDTLSLKFHNFAQIKVNLPSIEKQRRIADTLDAVDREIDVLTRQADALARQKKGLMEKLLAGQIRVKG